MMRLLARTNVIFVAFSVLLIPDARCDEGGGHEGRIFDFLLTSCDCKCGRPNRGTRLLGGEVSRGHEFPWFALIQTKGNGYFHGTLINSKYVITSASLLTGLTPYDVKVTLGLFDRCYSDVSSTNYSVEAIVVHPDYGPTNRAYDLGLLKLTGEVNFEKRMSPICLALPGKSYLGQVGTVLGWLGENKNDESVYCRPIKMGLPILGRRQCPGTASDPRYFSNDKGCVGIIGATSGICKDDAGGPVMYRDYDGVYELIGVLSDKNECGNRPSTALYTIINDHMSWLKQNTKDGCYCYK